MSTSTMSSSVAAAASTFSQGFASNIYARRLLLHTPLHNPSNSAASPIVPTGHDKLDSYAGESSFDANVVMILAVLLCALICALGLNSIIRCALGCSGRGSLESEDQAAATRRANTGVKRKALKTFPTVSYSVELKLPGLDSDCAICLSEFVQGDRVRVLPKCNHGFHVRCIDKWLLAHSSCPTCRQCLLETCKKIAGCDQSVLPESTATVLVPLEPEGLTINYSC